MRKITLLLIMFLLAALAGCVAPVVKADAPNPVVINKGDDFFVYAYNDRHYVVGSEESSEKFLANKMIPLTKTLLGAGPNGETVVFEFDKHHPEMTDRLVQTYESTPFLVQGNGKDFFVYGYNGRQYVVGSEESSEKFLANKMIPLTKTLLGAGPNGETVVFEFDKHHPEMTDRLVQAYN